MFSRESSEQLKQKNLLVRQLQNQIKTVEQSVKNKMNQDFDQIRAYERHQIQQLQASIEEFQRNSQADRELATQQEELIKQLQAKVHLAEVTTVEVANFPSSGIGGAREAGISPAKPFYESRSCSKLLSGGRPFSKKHLH
jgi:hypothetical protein